MNEQHIFMIRFVCVCSNLGGARRARRIWALNLEGPGHAKEY
jgi:hypothetical protein